MKFFWIFACLALAVLPVLGGSSGATLVAVGDIATCGQLGQFVTANITREIVKAIPNAQIALLGDIAYERGTTDEFQCFDAAWGEFKAITNPVPGNHEYFTANAAPYYAYFATRARDPKRGYYTYKLGDWRIFALNSNCAAIGGCDQNSVQVKWLKKTLAANPSQCSLAYWHHPRFSSGSHGDQIFMQDVWAVLAKAGVDVVLSAHDHTYERFKPLDSNGKVNPKGTRAFVVGTGGRSLYAFKKPNRNSQIKNNNTLGVLQLTLNTSSYEWQFKTPTGSSFTDSGTASCY